MDGNRTNSVHLPTLRAAYERAFVLGGDLRPGEDNPTDLLHEALPAMFDTIESLQAEVEKLRAQIDECPLEHESGHDPDNPDCGTPGACICP